MTTGSHVRSCASIMAHRLQQWIIGSNSGLLAPDIIWGIKCYISGCVMDPQAPKHRLHVQKSWAVEVTMPKWTA